MKKILMTAALAFGLVGGAASAATVGGNFTMDIVNVEKMDSGDSQAKMSNYNTAWSGGFGPALTSTGSYNGLLDFRVGAPQTATYSVREFIKTGSYTSFSGVTATLDAQLSYPNINDGSATTTFFLFTLANFGAGDFTVTHDDGFAIFDDGVRIGGRLGPVGETTTMVSGFNGGELSLLYVATNGNPSIFEVSFAPVPVPASLPLLLGALGGAGFLARRRKKAA